MANWEGGGLGEIIEKAWHTFKSLPEMMHLAVMKVRNAGQMWLHVGCEGVSGPSPRTGSYSVGSVLLLQFSFSKTCSA